MDKLVCPCLTEMNWIDYLIFATLFFAAFFGLASGPMIQLLRIGSIITSLFMALFFYVILSNILKGIFTLSTANLISYLMIFFVAFIITYIIIDVIKKMMGELNIGVGLRLLGGLLGVLKGLVFCGVIILGILMFCSKPTIDTVNTSKTAFQIGKGMQTMVSIIPQNVTNNIKGYAEGIIKSKSLKGAKSDKSDKSDKKNKSSEKVKSEKAAKDENSKSPP